MCKEGIECSFPLATGTGFTQYFDRLLFISHYIYWPVSYATQWDGTLTQNQLTWINTHEGAFWTAQQAFAAWPEDANGNYCLNSATFGSGVLYWPVAYTGAGCGSFKRIQMSQQAYDDYVAVDNMMTCVQCFIRSLIV